MKYGLKGLENGGGGGNIGERSVGVIFENGVLEVIFENGVLEVIFENECWGGGNI